MATTNDYKLDTNNKGMYVSIGLFFLVLFLTIALYFYNSYIVSGINNTEATITSVEKNIADINSDDKVKLYTLVTANQKFLQKYSDLSKIPEFINNLKLLSKDYGVTFEGFSYSDSTLVTTVFAIDDALSLASDKTKKIIEYFRKKDDNMFSLGFVNSFDGQNNIKFDAKFKIK